MIFNLGLVESIIDYIWWKISKTPVLFTKVQGFCIWNLNESETYSGPL
jgi:hypothetical protein